MKWMRMRGSYWRIDWEVKEIILAFKIIHYYFPNQEEEKMTMKTLFVLPDDITP